MNLSFYSINLPSVLKRFDLQSKNYIIKPNFTQVCAGTTDTNSLDQLCKTLSEQPIEPEIQLVEIPNVNAPPLRQVIRELDVVDTIKKYGVRIVYLDEHSLSEYGKFSSFHIPNLFLQRCEERLIVIAPPKEHKFLSGGIEISTLAPYLDGYSGVMKNLAVGIIHKNDMRKTHGVSKVITEKYETENLRLLWSMMTEEEKIGKLRKKVNRLNEEIVEKLEQRVEVSIKIGTVKRKYNKPIIDRTREKAVFKQIRVLAKKYNMDAEDVEKVFREIVSLCTNAQLKA